MSDNQTKRMVTRRKFVRMAILASPAIALLACGDTPTAVLQAQTQNIQTNLKPQSQKKPTPTPQPTAQPTVQKTASPTPLIDVAASYFLGKELLGLITDHSVTVKLIAAKELEAYLEFGTDSGNYSSKSNSVVIEKDKTFEIVIDNLQANTQYYYRLLYRAQGDTEFLAGNAYSFHTQRKPGDSFTFTIQADPHRDENTNEELYRRTLANILADKPDFHIDLGDTFMTEKFAKTEGEVINRYVEERQFFDLIGHSIPLFLVNGNHEGENGWLLNGKANNLAVWASNARNTYYLNPKPDSFYSGNGKEENFVGKRGGYYSWEWGNALFVTLDPFWYSTKKPSSFEANWNYTLGKEQYDWFKAVLEKSQANYKFVFSHNLVGGSDKDARGGIEPAKYFEWGGLNGDGSYGFDKNRAGWGKPIHQLMVENKVTAFFHGHDHFFAKQELDGIIYQLVPQPGNPAFNRKDQVGEYGYVNGVIMTSSGHLRVTVSNSTVSVDYVRAYLAKDENKDRKNGELAYNYVMVSD
ncbi:metallophosphoesterase [Candidatus Chlorohelix sp.]|uniref:metallophosphoesterase n=1 Tax=Candidatus Chlorohelix sp. TaxID=3139201 RepID=UPI0030396B76